MADDTLMIVDGSGVVMEWSHEAESLLGLPASQVLGLPATGLFTVGRGDHGAEEVRLRCREGHTATGELWVRPVLRDGAVAWEIGRLPTQLTRGSAGSIGASVLEALFTQSPIGLHILDAELRVVRFNTAARGMRGVPADSMLGRPLAQAYPLVDPAAEEAVARRVLEDGVPVLDRLVSLRLAADRGAERVFSVSIFRLRDPQGAVLGLAVSAVDVTDRDRAHAHAAVLAGVRERVGRSLDVVATCQEAADVLVPGYADILVVEVVDDVVRGEDPPIGPLGRDVPLRRAAFRSAAAQPVHPLGDVRTAPYGTPFGQALSDLRPRLLQLSAESAWFAADPAHAEAIPAAGAHSLITAPLTLRGTVLGLMSLYRCGESEPYADDDVGLCLELAAHTALCIDNARRFTRERTIAATTQRRLLPQSTGQCTALDTAWLHLPADGGASWFDTIALPGARTALVTGNTSGQGISAATTMGQLRTAIHTLAALDLEPDELLARLHDTTGRLAEERAALPPADPLHKETLTASCLYGIYDPITRTCTLACAGHPAPIIVHPDGSTRVCDVPAGTPLGSAENLPRATAHLELAQDSILAFYTASLLPQTQTEPDVLLSALRRSHRPLQSLCDDVVYALGSQRPRGDAALLLARACEIAPDHVATWQLTPDATAAGKARHLVRRQLTEWNQDEETVFTTELIASELATNAVRYGTPPLQLRLILEHTLTCEMADAGDSAPRLRHARSVDENGRGLFIVSQLAHRWGTRYNQYGKTIWTEQPLSPQ
ncbi:SpoIIE family protein phosphatase [Streptomyces sp. NPDC056121]|uniref:SpoIIE family protein phosphatase n=2 Tax=Streptomyces TaxID=1883 RepID=UPI001D09B78E|nr:SpoIIE family protein phosphatase [Streptomyces longhuiensis]UDM04869.1 SpoIIE family protein phosphatase [Streptomyces longhuiensis]